MIFLKTNTIQGLLKTQDSACFPSWLNEVSMAFAQSSKYSLESSWNKAPLVHLNGKKLFR